MPTKPWQIPKLAKYMISMDMRVLNDTSRMLGEEADIPTIHSIFSVGSLAVADISAEVREEVRTWR